MVYNYCLNNDTFIPLVVVLTNPRANAGHTIETERKTEMQPRGMQHHHFCGNANKEEFNK